MALHIQMDLDTDLEVVVSPAFALVQFRFQDPKGQKICVSLDMEAAVRVLQKMDNGPDAIAQIPKPSIGSRLLSITLGAIGGFVFAVITRLI